MICASGPCSSKRSSWGSPGRQFSIRSTMGPARESIDSGQPKSQAIGVSHLTHDELAVWIDDAYIVSFLVRTVSLAVLEFVVEMLDPSHPGLPSRQATWEDHPAPSSPTSLQYSFERDLCLDLFRKLLIGPTDRTHQVVGTPEPLPPDSPLWALPNVMLTAHYAGWSDTMLDRIYAIFSENLRRFDRGEPLRNQVDVRSGY